jgi:hypothetical protein
MSTSAKPRADRPQISISSPYPGFQFIQEYTSPRASLAMSGFAPHAEKAAGIGGLNTSE